MKFGQRALLSIPGGLASAGRDGLLAERWQFPLAVFALSRVFFLLFGALAAAVVPWSDPPASRIEQPSGDLAYWARWDGVHYLYVAAHGYAAETIKQTAFFPLYPLAARLLTAPLGDPVLAGLVVSLVSFAIALVLLYRVAEFEWGRAVARRAVLCLACFPSAFFFNATYSESLFLALSLGAVWAVRVRRDLVLACTLAALA